MTVPLSPGSSRLVAARRFGEELDRAMRARKVGAKRLGPLTGIAISAIGNWRAGLNLPRYDTSLRLAESLAWPRLAAIVRDARTQPCARCGLPFLDEGGGQAKRFCSQACRQIDAQLRKPMPGVVLAGELRDLLASREGLKGGLPKAVVADAVARFGQAEAKGRQRVDQQGRLLADHRLAVEAMCRSCEPEGRCRDAACPLRAVSPLPLLTVERHVEAATPAEGAHGPTHRDAWLTANRAGQARRWAREGERERMAELGRARIAALTDEQRAERSRRISAGIRAHAPRRRSEEVA